MDDTRAQPLENALLVEDLTWDTESIMEQIWRELDGTVSREDICRVLCEVAPTYQDARIQTYVPVFIRRDVLRRLRDEFAQYEHV